MVAQFVQINSDNLVLGCHDARQEVSDQHLLSRCRRFGGVTVCMDMHDAFVGLLVCYVKMVRSIVFQRVVSDQPAVQNRGGAVWM